MINLPFRDVSVAQFSRKRANVSTLSLDTCVAILLADKSKPNLATPQRNSEALRYVPTADKPLLAPISSWLYGDVAMN